MEAALKSLARRVVRRVRVSSTRHMYWWKGPPYNFGDWIGPWLYRARTGHDPVFRRPSNRSLTTTLVTAGSLARHVREDCVVWGSGIIETDTSIVRPHRTLAVRGPLTRERFLELELPCPPVYGDPGILLPRYCDPARQDGPAVALVPHYIHLEAATRLYASAGDVRIVDVRRPVEEVVAAITSCAAVVSSSLHGLIVGHAFGLPTVWGTFEGRLAGDDVKFADHYRAGGVEIVPEPAPLEGGLDPESLFRRAEKAPRPELGPLRDPLLEACPF